MSRLSKLQRLYQLKKIAAGKKGLDTNQLEEDFLAFSAYSPKKALTVMLPRLYQLHEDEHRHYAAALGTLGIDTTKLPEGIDVSGCFNATCMQNAMIFVSLQQIQADHYLSTRSRLNPLIEKTYTEAAELIRDFAIHEVVVGKVTAKRGDVDLNDAHLLPRKFMTGPYELHVELDTPTGMITKFRELSDLLDEFTANPKANLLDEKKMEEAVSKGIELRKILGSLSRYDVPKTQDLYVETNSYNIRTDKYALFYLYSPSKRQNIAVYFGESPFEKGKEPKNLMILDGDAYQHTLAKLVEQRIYEVSIPILEKRIEGLQNMYESAARGSNKAIAGDFPVFDKLVSGLKDVEECAKAMINPNKVVEYCLNQPPELFEFMVYPTTEDPIIHELLPRISWKEAVRTYHNTGKFIRTFDAGDEELRERMLEDISANIMFSNQQNNNVNKWLYQNYHDLCLDAGIKFDIVK